MAAKNGGPSRPPRLHAARTANEKPDISIPQARRIAVDTTGAQIVQEESPATRDSRGIYLPRYIEPVSHIAIDIGGSLAKVVYFTRQTSPLPRTPPESGPSSPFLPPAQSVSPLAYANPARLPDETSASASASASAESESRRPTLNGTLTPQILSQLSNHLHDHSQPLPSISHSNGPSSIQSKSKHRLGSCISTHPKLRRSSIPPPLPGGVLNFARFETANIDELIDWLNELITTSATVNKVSVERMRSMVKVMVTGGGAYMYYDRLKDEVGVEVKQEEEMECLITGLGFAARVPEEVFWFSDALVYKVSHTAPNPALAVESGPDGAGSVTNDIDTAQPSSSSSSSGSLAPPAPAPPQQPQPQAELERPSPTPPQYSVTFAPVISDPHPHPSSSDDTSTGQAQEPETNPNFPCLLVNIGSGVSIVKVDEDGKFERVSGTSLGGGTLWGLLSLLTDARSFDEMLLLSEQGDNAAVDMLVGDIYGSDYSKIGLKSSTIASTFGKVFKKGQSPEERKKGFRQEDVARSLLYAISNNIGHVAYMNAAKYGLDKVFFGGCFIRGHAATISTLSYAIRFWSKGTMRACFLRHEGFLGSIGAWIKNVEPSEGEAAAQGQDQGQDQIENQQRTSGVGANGER